MSTINQVERIMHYDEQIEQIENEIRALQDLAPAENTESNLNELLDKLFLQLHTLITLKCVISIEPDNMLVLEAIESHQALQVLDVALLAQGMSKQVDNLHDSLLQANSSDERFISQTKQLIAEFFIARQMLVDAAINESSEADYFCDCKTCQQSTYHQFTAAFDFVCTQCEQSFFS